MKLRRTVARNIKELRREKGISQEELADRADINRNYVGMIERSENAATVDMLEKWPKRSMSNRASSFGATKGRFWVLHARRAFQSWKILVNVVIFFPD